MSVRMTEEQVTEYRAKLAATLKRVRGGKTSLMTSAEINEQTDVSNEPGFVSNEESFVGLESELQFKCEAFLRGGGFYFFHDRSKRANDPGLLDLVIALPEGRTIWVELKTKGHKTTKDQKRTILRLQYLGHHTHVVRSFGQFTKLIGSYLFRPGRLSRENSDGD